MDQLEREIERAMAMGQRNAELIELARKHCAHIRVELSPLGGFSMVEQATGLPISMRQVRCEHAAKAGGTAANLEFIVLNFYEQNCQACQHRQLLGVPNLATMAEVVAAERIAGEELETRARRDAESARVLRREERNQMVKGESRPTRDLIARINLLDAEEEPAGIGEELAAIVKGAPQLVTRPAAEILVAVANELGSEHVLEAVRYAAEASRVSEPDALRVAVVTLAKRHSAESARLLLRFPNGLTSELLAPAKKSLIHMAGRVIGPPFLSPDRAEEQKTLWMPAFELLVAVDLAGVLLDLEGMLESDSEFERERAGAAAEVLVGLQPEVVPVLGRQLVAAIALSPDSGFYDDQPHPTAALVAALANCLRVDPLATQKAIEEGAPRLDDDQRERLFDAYCRVAGFDDDEKQIPAEAAEVVVEACLKHAKGDWGVEAQRAAIDALRSIARSHCHLLRARGATLFSLLIDAISQELASPTSTSQHPQLAALEQRSQIATRNYRILRIRETIGILARQEPQEVLDHVRAFVSDESLETDPAKEMRAECVRLLGEIGACPGFMHQVLPAIYRAVVHRDQLMRSMAIEALQEVSTANRGSALPFEFSATLPALLCDPYRIVHRAAARALAFGLPVREEHRLQVIAALLQLANAYAQSGDDRDILDDAILALLRLGTSSNETTLPVRQVAARLARHLEAGNRVRFLTHHATEMLELPEYVEVLVEALQDPAVIHEQYSDDEALRGLLHRVPAELLVHHAGGLRAAALANLPLRVGPAVQYVEVLQRLGLWTDAAKLAEEITDKLPTTTENAVVRTLAETVLAGARTEQTIAQGEKPRGFLESWADAEERYLQARREAETESPWKG